MLMHVIGFVFTALPPALETRRPESDRTFRGTRTRERTTMCLNAVFALSKRVFFVFKFCHGKKCSAKRDTFRSPQLQAQRCTGSTARFVLLNSKRFSSSVAEPSTSSSGTRNTDRLTRVPPLSHQFKCHDIAHFIDCLFFSISLKTTRRKKNMTCGPTAESDGRDLGSIRKQEKRVRLFVTRSTPFFPWRPVANDVPSRALKNIRAHFVRNIVQISL